MQDTSIIMDSHGQSAISHRGGRRLSDAQIDEVVALREAGWTMTAIAARFGVKKSLIEWHCLRLGAEPPDRLYALRRVPEQPSAYVRAGRLVRLYTRTEDERLLALACAGQSQSRIAQALRRSVNSVTGRLMILARREARAERQA
ncbi:hypothetical protein [Asticcacaulis sp. EMRT-3]|uniref:hypothetical protein n=1 Tax=Asticcacaulis sp. EMRT-3 TaxID=3040349 RepID=UPI0024AFDB92|nr:hypothetical protein [Asticcacaulis sp. EMRT-3]MDI7773756.1 hypothetical protein [Asticcacaulis sp. EMRT-3]